jgi:murein DD-endopeptidase MepM/ murein hydrolase activator NlpD
MLLILVVALLAVGFFYFRDTTGPLLTLSPDSGAVSARRELTVNLEDPKSGLKTLSITAVQGDNTIEVLNKKFEPGTHSATETFTLPATGLKEGSFELRIGAVDRAIYHFGAGNTTEETHQFDYDNKPPVVAVLSTAHNLTQGGAGLVVYTLSEKPEKTGVVFGDSFYPGYLQENNFYACLFPFPYNADPSKYNPRVLAVDKAGNERMAGFYYHLTPKPQPRDTIHLNDPFLAKIAAEFQDKFPQTTSPLDLYLQVNRELRVQNRKSLGDYGLQTSPVPLWDGAFLRQPNAAPMGAFAQDRTYLYQGKKVDEQTHLGIDLASVAHAPILAANDGKVVYADYFGIYGQCVIIDHGLGLQTLYGHMSQVGVKVGDEVKKGQPIGNTGSTGLAGGDHLHFGIILSGTPVNPVEWWDPSWLKNNVTSKFDLEKSLVPGK